MLMPPSSTCCQVLHAFLPTYYYYSTPPHVKLFSESSFSPSICFHPSLSCTCKLPARRPNCLSRKIPLDPSLIEAPSATFLAYLLLTQAALTSIFGSLLDHSHIPPLQGRTTRLSQFVMYSLSGRQLLTCRYWAFGSRCPDIDVNNVQTCQYAHWDTGRLADFYEQRGTCYDWFHRRVCPFGVSCSYEHRDTGVIGLNQGSKSPRRL